MTHVLSAEPFNECVAVNGTGTASFCNATTGEAGFGQFTDGTCQEYAEEFTVTSGCTVTVDECTDDIICSKHTICTSEGEK